MSEASNASLARIRVAMSDNAIARDRVVVNAEGIQSW